MHVKFYVALLQTSLYDFLFFVRQHSFFLKEYVIELDLIEFIHDLSLIKFLLAWFTLPLIQTVKIFFLGVLSLDFFLVYTQTIKMREDLEFLMLVGINRWIY